MISSTTINIVNPITASLANNGICLSPVEGSPLSLLLKCHNMVSSEGATNEGILQKVASTSEPNFPSKFSPHCAEQDAIKMKVAPIIRQSIRTAANVCVPIISQVVAKAEEEISEIEADNPLNINIVHHDLPAIYTNGSLEKMLGHYKDAALRGSNLTYADIKAALESVTKEQFLEANISHNEDFNNELRTLLSNVELAGVVGNNLAEQQLSPVQVGFYNDHSDLLTYLFIKSLMADKFPGFPVDGLSMGDRIKFSAHLTYSAIRLSKKIELFERHLLTKAFKLSPKGVDDRVIHVLDRSYMKWLNAGGTAEALMAYCRNGGGGFPALDEVDKYNAAYDKLLKSNSNRMTIKTNDQVKNVMYMAVRQAITEKYEDINVRKAKFKLLAEASENIFFTAKDLIGYGRKLVTSCIGNETDACILLETADEIIKANPEKSINEAVLEASAELIVNWLTNQVKVTVGKGESPEVMTAW